MSKPPKPVVIDADALGPADHAVSDAPPIPEAEEERPPEGRAMRTATRLAARRRGPVARLFWWAVAGLLSLMIGAAFWDFVTGLLARNAILGQVALGLAGIVALGLVLAALREIAGIARLARVDALQTRAGDPAARRERARALAVSDSMLALYAAREDLRLPSERLKARQGDILDADALLEATETALLTPLDAAARAEVERAARTVAAATAIVPLALVDVAVALSANLGMVRRIAEIYGGRAGTFGSLRLMRAVASHLLATGAVAVGDDMISSVAGGGVVSKLSRRFGEGVVNGALTARVGIAAMEVCRPMPFAALPRPRVTRLVQRALTGMFSQG
ncbi:YcjF family protein [Oceanibium sediminis]|uniref:YcjF family protein n=1 Tax=Oceanibium sediminis TaxID=2026339 RepID=UPI000DD446B1|nr:TIGR01620 family protein [Oceanibium sediminis]